MAFTLAIPRVIFLMELYATVFRAAEGSSGWQIGGGDVDRSVAAVWYG